MTERITQNAECGDELIATSENGTVMVPVSRLGDVIREMMGPVLEGLARALEQVAAQQQVQSDRMEALERQIRLQTPVTAKQAGFLNAAARERAAALLDKKGVNDPNACKKLAGIIRKAVMKRYGIGSMRDVPGYEYRVAMDMIDMWSDALAVSKIARQAQNGGEVRDEHE